MKAETHEQPMFKNRTGIMTHPELSSELIKGAMQTPPDPDGDPAEIVANRAEYLGEALPIGSKPEILSRQGSGEEAARSTEDETMALFLDKLGERLAFERQGTRLYESVVQKCELLGVVGNGAGPAHEDLIRIHDQELAHFHMLQRIIADLGGDPTVQSPSADVAGVLSLGILQVVNDPRTSVAQTMQAMLNAELADNDGWQMLIDLSCGLGLSDLEQQFESALQAEQEHLESVRAWLEEMTLQEANALPDDGELIAGDEAGAEVVAVAIVAPDESVEPGSSRQRSRSGQRRRQKNAGSSRKRKTKRK